MNEFLITINNQAFFPHKIKGIKTIKLDFYNVKTFKTNIVEYIEIFHSRALASFPGTLNLQRFFSEVFFVIVNAS